MTTTTTSSVTSALASFRAARADRAAAKTALEAVDAELAAALKACPEKCPTWGTAAPAAAARIRAEFATRHESARRLEQRAFEALGHYGIALAAAYNAEAASPDRYTWCNHRQGRWQLGWGIYDRQTGSHRTISQL